MAKDSEKLGYKDFFDEALFTPVIENVNALIASLQGLRDTIKSGIVPALNELKAAISAFADNQKAGADEARRVADAMSKVTAAAKAYSKIQDELIRLASKRIQLESEEAKIAAILKLEIREAEKALKRYAQVTTASARASEALAIAEKALKGQIDANVVSYYHLSDALDALRERYKSLVLAGQENTEEAARLRDAIVQLDKRIKEADEKVGQFQRNVGNYTKSFKDAMTEFLGASGKAGEAVLALSFAAERARDAFIAAGGGVRGFFRAIVEGTKALRGVGIMLILEGISKLLSAGRNIEAIEAAERKVRLAAEELRINNDLSNIKLRLASLDENTIKGLTEKGRLLSEQARKEIELIRLRRAYIEEELKRTQEQIKENIESPLNKILTWLGKAVGAIVRMLAYIPKGFAEVLRALKATAAADVLANIANKAEEAAAGIEKVFASFVGADIASLKEKSLELQQQLAELSAQEREIIQQSQKAQEEILEAQTRLIDEAIKAIDIQVEAAGTAREKLRAEYEKMLKDLEEAYNEHVKKLEGNNEAIEQLRNKYLAKVAELNAWMARKEAEILEAAFRQIESIRRNLMENALDIKIAEINERYDSMADELRKALAEIGETNEELLVRLENKRQKEIQKAILEAAESELKLREEIARARLETERINFEREEDFIRYKEKKLAEMQIEFAQQRIQILRDLYDLTGDATLELEIAKNEAIIANAMARLKEMAKRQAEEIMKEYIKAIDTITNALNNYISKIEDRQLASMQRQQNMLRSRIAVYEGLAKQGALAADQSIAELEAREAELIRKQEELKRKAQRREMALAAIKTYVQLLDRNAPSPLAQTIRDITAITQFISRLPTFYYGTEYVKEGVRIPNAVRDALIVRVHEGERIVPVHINRQLGGIKNEDLPKLINNANITARVEFDYDSLTNAIVTSISESNKKRNIRRRL